MAANSYSILFQIAAAASFAGAIYVNYLAQKLPINGLTQRDISDSLPNLITPAGFTFSIWGVIYLMLAVFTVFQFGITGNTPAAGMLDTVRLIFIVNMLANIGWMYVWHYRKFELSAVMMGIILITLILIHLEMDKLLLTNTEKIVFRLPFSLYFGWITVAAVVNVTALLVARHWKRLGLSEQTWSLIILVVAALIGTATMLNRKDIAYGLVFIWAYYGILTKHRSPQEFDNKYPLIIRTVLACVLVFFVSILLIAFKVL